ncbi:4-hydroxy-3-polyprenylbenzoate decarboxylase [Mariprofundus ferrinatatus]|uniref:Flavin prenyltransferase UbiX n=1 Tax=Mariprofundus ferrinatatus TaxID=1921087 RepID=A0A2K8L472_9PROT|nr:flavin prenyltransferase UbiX [Mariprofundus ferrinatatus]ATX82128.1 4-hydroxy-3-polyprenylbenzoate decarboxylase [Mariprofundus ferrinatatus]
MSNAPQQEPIIVAMTGASGAAYGLRLIQRLADAGITQHLILSDAARVVLKQEADLELPADTDATTAALAEHLTIPSSRLCCYSLSDWFSPAASGSASIRRMVVIPCSMGTLARIASGLSGNLIERAADVVLKEKRQLILVPRETPLSTIHLENMLKLSRMGVDIIPAMPAFYHRPTSLDEIVDYLVDRVLDHLKVVNPEAKQWGSS